MFMVTRALVSSVQKIMLAVLLASPLFAGLVQANTAPSIWGTPAATATVGKPYYFKPSARDPDGQRLIFGIKNKPAWATLRSDTGELTGTPTAAGTWYNIVIVVWDGAATSALPAFSIKATTTTSATNRAPTISGTPWTSVTVGSTYSFRPTVYDANGDRLGFSIQNRPAWAAFNTSTGQLAGTPNSSHVGTNYNIIITVSDGKVRTSLPAFSIVVRAASGTTNTAPRISGTPATSVKPGYVYSFTPSASDANGDKLAFSISNKPSWATFSTSTGKLYGTPTTSHVGTYSSIVIRVSDGKVSTALPAFSIKVATASTTTGAATLSWTPPTRNTDGSTLTNLNGYRIYYGTSSGALSRTINISNVGITTYMIEGLTTGTTYYFAVKAVNSTGVESSLSNLASKTIR